MLARLPDALDPLLFGFAGLRALLDARATCRRLHRRCGGARGGLWAAVRGPTAALDALDTDSPPCAELLCRAFAITAEDVLGSDALMLAGGHGRLAVLKWAVAHFAFSIDDLRDQQPSVITAACAGGHRAVAEWFAARDPAFSGKNIMPDALADASTEGHLATVKWCIYFDRESRSPTLTYNNVQRGFLDACKEGHMDVVEFLGCRLIAGASDARSLEWVATLGLSMAVGHFRVMYWIITRFKLTARQCPGALSSAAGRGLLVNTIWLAARFHAASADDLDVGVAVSTACGGGRWHIATWLLEKYPAIDNAETAILALREVCYAGHLEIAQRLVERYKISRDIIPRGDDGLLVLACQGEQQDVAEWVVAEFGMPIEDRQAAIAAVCEGGLDILVWAAPYFNISADYIRQPNCKLLYNTVAIGDVDLLEWVIGHFGLAAEDIIAHNLVRVCFRRGSYGAARWLMEEFGPAIVDWTRDDFASVCRTGTLEYAKWAADYFKPTADDVRAGAFAGACEVGNYYIVKWLAERYALTAADVAACDGIALARRALDQPPVGRKNALVRWLTDQFGPSAAGP